MTDEIDYSLLAALLAGECTADEAARVRAWIAASSENAEAFRDFELVWRTASRGAVSWDVERAWRKVHDGFHERPRLKLAPPRVASDRPGAFHRPVGWRGFFGRSAGWAAAVALALVGTSVVVVNRLARPTAQGVEGHPMRQVATAKGHLTSVRLSDGTRVLLSADSKLRFPAGFGGTRDVYLEGEAFFDVMHDPSRPFVVHAAGASTRVLGTKFSVRAYAGEPDVRVAVAEGRVRLRPERADSAAGVVLARNQLGRVSLAGEVSVHRDVDVQEYMDWVSGRIAFEDAPLREVLRELRYWYDADFILTDPSLDSLRLTAAFRQEPLDVVVRAIARTLDLEWQRAGSAIVFSRPSRIGQ